MTRSSRDFPHQFLIPKQKSHWEAKIWCTEHFGDRWDAIGNREGTWCVFWRGRESPGTYEWFFQNEQDAIMFAVRWA